MYYFAFFRFLLLLSRRKNDYNYGMALVIFTYTISLFIMPIVIILMKLIVVTPPIFFWGPISIYCIIWILNYVLTRKKHRLIYSQFYDANKHKKYSVLLITLAGMLYFFCCNMIL